MKSSVFEVTIDDDGGVIVTHEPGGMKAALARCILSALRFTPTPDCINALPEPLRRYIHDMLPGSPPVLRLLNHTNNEASYELKQELGRLDINVILTGRVAGGLVNVPLSHNEIETIISDIRAAESEFSTEGRAFDENFKLVNKLNELLALLPEEQSESRAEADVQ